MQGNLCSDSRAIRTGDTFLAWPGTAHDARHHVASALERGAAQCWVEKNGAEAFDFANDARVTCIENLQTQAGAMASEFFRDPSHELSVIAVTGTNGKTSTAWWLAQALAGGMVGTLGVGRVDNLRFTGLTTPDPAVLHGFFRQLVDEGVKTCAIEASSIGIEEHRLNGTRVRIAVLTNFTQDHLDYHGDMAAYGAAKRKLFDWAGLETAVINIDDPFGMQLAQALSATKNRANLKIITVSCTQPARLQARNIRYENGVGGQGGLCFDVCEGDERHSLQTMLIGEYNIANLLGVMGAMRALGMPLVDVVQACRYLTPVPGRMERVAEQVVIDYAHTPDALQHVLQALQPVAQQRGGRLWCVFGCGGDRDAAKRPLMGAIAARYADCVVITSDNPRSESPQTIIDQIVAGIPDTSNVIVQPDRAAAIDDAVRRSTARDIVLIAGKGHESTQEIAGVKTPFSDKTHAQIPYARVHTDTRTIQAGDLFVAIKGDNYDGNAFLHEAYARGAIAAICHPDAVQPAGMVCFTVPDTRKALCQLAQDWRAKFAIPLIAVTGSNGKTTVTQMIASILATAYPDGHFLATQGNFNNDIGVALTLLRLRSTHRIAVVEMGMNHAGEIAGLAAMARPTVALINNAQREHLEFMRTVQAVAEENGSVIHALDADGVLVIPADDDYTPLWRTMAGHRKVVTFAMDKEQPSPPAPLPQGEGRSSHAELPPLPVGEGWGEGFVSKSYQLAIAGRHNQKNALAAAACARAAGVNETAIRQGLEAFAPVKGRSRTLQIGRLTVIDDTYNANPDSVRAAIDVLSDLPAPRLLVLGDMGEVGEDGAALHAEVGAYAQTKGIEKMFTLGDLSRHVGHGVHCASMDELIDKVHQTLPHVGSVLVKGSRFMRMERVIGAMESSPA